MDRLWKAAFAVGGVAAIGAFVFWSLYRQWLSLVIFERLSQRQTFVVMLVFLSLTFLALVSAFVLHAKRTSPTDNREDLFETYREKVVAAMARNDSLINQFEVRAELAIDGLEAILLRLGPGVETSEATNALNLVKASPRMVRGLVEASRKGRSIEDVERMTNNRGELGSLRQMLNNEQKNAGNLSDHHAVLNEVETIIRKFESI